LILDEAMAGLDDQSFSLIVALINQFAAESNTTILYVSHRVEEGLSPRSVFELVKTESGSVGIVKIK
jgi:molybdate transport system ATP-binding protein